MQASLNTEMGAVTGRNKTQTSEKRTSRSPC